MSDENTKDPKAESFDAEMRKLLGKSEPDKPDPVKAEESQETPADAGVSASGAPESAEPAKEDKPEAATKPEGDGAKPDVKAEPEKPATEDTFDPASLTGAAKKAWDEMQEKYKQLEQDRNRHAKAVAPLQQRLRQLEQTKPAPPQKPSEAQSSRFKTPQWLRFRKEYGEDAEGIEAELLLRDQHNEQLQKKIDALEQRFAPLTEKLSQLDQIEAERERREQVRELTTAHPDWQQHVKVAVQDDGTVVFAHMSPEFRTWYGSRKSFEREAINAVLCGDDALSHIELMDAFTASRQPAGAKPSELQTKREEVLRNAVAPTTRAPVSTAQIDPSTLSPAERFAFELRQARERMAQGTQS